jgi:hypothetical protein
LLLGLRPIKSGVQKVQGFDSEEAAYRNWLSERERQLSVWDQDGGGESLSDLTALYLDGDKSMNGMVWNRVQPREDNLATVVPKSPRKVVPEEERLDRRTRVVTAHPIVLWSPPTRASHDDPQCARPLYAHFVQC